MGELCFALEVQKLTPQVVRHSEDGHMLLSMLIEYNGSGR